ncbi:hypothetical protein [Chitinophaga flava]|uniref:hypothetical protein n=1 Tax=Chitinophaga flava TaxID=2259036 RepID=UPI0011BF9C01|nr:hypothetical protein [Chitinophaga flava]
MLKKQFGTIIPELGGYRFHRWGESPLGLLATPWISALLVLLGWLSAATAGKEAMYASLQPPCPS